MIDAGLSPLRRGMTSSFGETRYLFWERTVAFKASAERNMHVNRTFIAPTVRGRIMIEDSCTYMQGRYVF
jgi:hypothetical protein